MAPAEGPLAGRVVLLTGLSRRIGIGYGLAERLLADGACVLASGWEPHDAEMPWGVDSDLEASLGVGIRLHVGAAGGPNVFRADFALPVTAPDGQRDVVFRFYTEIFGLLDRRTFPTQTARSHWYGIDADMTTRPINPLAGN